MVRKVLRARETRVPRAAIVPRGLQTASDKIRERSIIAKKIVEKKIIIGKVAMRTRRASRGKGSQKGLVWLALYRSLTMIKPAIYVMYALICQRSILG